MSIKDGPFACQCCGATTLHPEMRARLARLWEQLADDPPHVAVGYRCEKAQQAFAWRYDPAHHEGRAITFDCADQYYFHRLLTTCLQVFDAVFIYPRRLTVHVGAKQSAPFALVM